MAEITADLILNTKILLRRAEFDDACVLAQGEPGYHTGTKIFKVGDGATTWANLPFANQAQIEALIKVVDDKVAALNDTYATDAEVKEIKEALQAAIDAKVAQSTYDTYVADRQLTDTQINTAIGNVDAKFADYTKTADQEVIDAEQDRRLGVLEAKPFDTYATKTEVQGVADDLAEYEEANDARVKAIEDEMDTFGDIVTHNASEFETSGAAAAAEGRITETLKNYYTKTEADAEFATPAEVIEEVNKAIATVADSDTTANITALVDYVEKNASDLTGLITEVYGSAAMTGNSRIDEIAAKPAMSITEDQIGTWDTALQEADLADYAKTADVVTNDEFTAFEKTNTEAIAAAKKAGEDAAAAVAEDFAEYIDGKSMSDADLKKYADDAISTFNTSTVAPIDERVKAIENAPYATTGNVATAKQEAIDAAKQYADGLDHEDTTYTVAATENALEFTVTPTGKGSAQTVTLVAPTVDTGVMSVTAGTSNQDIIVSTTEGAVTVSHKDYQTGTVKAAAHDSATDPSFVTGITIENGHVTGATVQNLKEVLKGMTIVLDGGTLKIG